MSITLSKLNGCDRAAFVAVCGPLFEHSPWIAEQAFAARPFSDLQHLHRSMCDVVRQSSSEQQLALIRAHPDLVGRLAREGRLTQQSTTEQAAAGLSDLSAAEADAFERFNSAYREKFGFPFVICARENKKHAILAAFPVRLEHDRDAEVFAALTEIFKIAWLRLQDAVSER